MKKLNFNIGTEFQKLVWKEIAKIPNGKVITYQDLALKINQWIVENRDMPEELIAQNCKKIIKEKYNAEYQAELINKILSKDL